MEYLVQHSDGERVTIEAKDEAMARRKAMVKRYGERPNPQVVPHAPEYNGYGLIVTVPE